MMILRCVVARLSLHVRLWDFDAWSAVAFIAATGIAVGAGLALQTQPYDGPTRVVSVTSGDSVWSLAQGVSTTRPLKDVVNDIEELNDVQGALQVGQEVRVPTR